MRTEVHRSSKNSREVGCVDVGDAAAVHGDRAVRDDCVRDVQFVAASIKDDVGSVTAEHFVVEDNRVSSSVERCGRERSHVDRLENGDVAASGNGDVAALVKPEAEGVADDQIVLVDEVDGAASDAGKRVESSIEGNSIHVVKSVRGRRRSGTTEAELVGFDHARNVHITTRQEGEEKFIPASELVRGVG